MDYEVSILGKERVITRKDVDKVSAVSSTGFGVVKGAITFDELLLLLGAGDLRGTETENIKEIVIESPTFVVRAGGD